MSWTKFRKLACYLCTGNLTIWIGIIGFDFVNLVLWPVFPIDNLIIGDCLDQLITKNNVATHVHRLTCLQNDPGEGGD